MKARDVNFCNGSFLSVFKSIFGGTNAKFVVLLVVAMGMWGGARGEEQTITLTYSNFGLTTSYAIKTATVDDFGFEVNQGYKGSGNVIQMNSSRGNGTLYNTTPIPGLKSVTVNVNSGNNTYTVYQGNSQEPTTNSAGTGSTTSTINITSGQYFTLKVSGASYFSSIIITYETGSSAPCVVSFNAGSGSCSSGSLTETSAGAGVTLPSAAPSQECATAGWIFVGWASASCSETTIAPNIVGQEGETYYPLDNCTLYAVYMLEDGCVGDVDVIFNPGTDVDFPNNGITVSVSNGTLTNGTDYRVYKSATLTISTTNGTISQIDLTYTSNTYDGGGWATSYTNINSTSWTSPTASGEQARITRIVVHLANATTDCYNSNPSCSAPSTVSISYLANGGQTSCSNVTDHPYNTNYSICATAPTKDCYDFTGWSDGTNTYQAGATIQNVTNNITLTARWTQKTFAITPSVVGNGTISPSSVTNVNCGSSKEFTITPNTCNRIKSVKVDGNDVTSQLVNGKYTFTNVTAPHTIAAEFEALPALSSIAITTPPTKTTYIEGENFNPAGMVVTATYVGGSTANVTSLCSYSPSGALTTSDESITVSYTECGVTKTTTQSITVTALPKYTVSFSTGSARISAPAALTESAYQSGVVLSSIEACGDYEFIGWSETEVTDGSETTSDICYGPNTTYKPTANTTLYAVYRIDDDSEYMLIGAENIVSGGNCLIQAARENANEYVMTNSLNNGHLSGNLCASTGSDDDGWFINNSNPSIVWRLYGNAENGYSLYNVESAKYVNLEIGGDQTLVLEDSPKFFEINVPDQEYAEVEFIAPYFEGSNNYLAFYYNGGYFNAYSRSATPIYIFYNDALYTSTPDCNCETATAYTTNATYTVGGSALDLSEHFITNNESEAVYSCISNNSESCTIDGSSFTATEAGEYEINVIQEPDGTYCRVSKTLTVTVKYKVDWYVNGSLEATDVYDEGDDLVIPDVETGIDCGEKVFLGWTAHENYSDEDDAPDDLFVSASGNVSASATYYAVFANLNVGGGSEWELVTDAATLAVGDLLVIASSSKGKVASDISNEIMTETSSTFSNDKSSITELAADAIQFTLLGNSSAWVLKNGTNSLGATAVKKLAWDDGITTWSITISNNNATIQNATDSYGRFLHNVNNRRFTTYTSETNISMLLPQLYRKSSSYGSYSTTCVPCLVPPTISATVSATDITTTAVSLSSEGITSFGENCHITSYGFVIGTSENPTLENGSVEIVGRSYPTADVAFDKLINNLTPCQTYHFRAYATNGNGTVYSNDAIFTTESDANITSLNLSCVTNTTAQINIEYTSCTQASDIFVVAIRKGANGPTSLRTTLPENINSSITFGDSDSQFGSGIPYSYVVYKSDGVSNATQITITGLEAGATYKLKAYKWIADENKWTTDGTTMSLEMPKILHLHSENDELSTLLTWGISKPICNGHYIVVCKEGSDAVTSSCNDFSVITANATFGSGTETQTGEYIVYNDEETSVSISGLTSGTEYTAAVFYVDDAGNCSSPVSITFTYSETTILELGDLAIIGINSVISPQVDFGAPDEISFVIFRKITPGTAIDFTDNGYGRKYEGRWGTTEGFLRLTWNGPTSLEAGSVVTITELEGDIGANADYNDNRGVPHNVNRPPVIGSNIIVYTNGSSENQNYWEIDRVVDGPLDLNAFDQIWFMQGGSWVIEDNLEHNAYYTGNVLYGFTASGWETTVGDFGAKGSLVFPGNDCFATNISVDNEGMVKFTGDLPIDSEHALTKREWISRINDPENWTTYDDAESYINDTRNYRSFSGRFYVKPGEGFTAGKWSGSKNGNWCDCANWISLVVPNENVDVEIPNVGVNHEIELNSEDTAVCKSLTIKNNGRLRNMEEGSTLKVVEDITIETGGTFRPTEGSNFEIILGGNFVNNGVFRTNENTSLTLIGDNSHIIDAPSGHENMKLKNLSMTSAENGFAVDTIELYGKLNDNSSSHLGFAMPQSLTFAGSAAQTATATKLTNVTLNKTAGQVTMSGPLQIESKGIFNKGVIVGNVTFAEDAVAENATYNSYVQGSVTKKASDAAFTFPNGSNGMLGSVSVAAGKLTADATVTFGHDPDGFSTDVMPSWWNQNNMCEGEGDNDKFDHVSNMLNWNISTAADIDGVTFLAVSSADVQFNEATENRNADAIKVAVYDGCWKNIGGTADVVDDNENSIHQISISGVDIARTNRAGGQITFGSTNHPTLLPIELLFFSASCEGTAVAVSWSTASENDNDYFVLERSADAVNFTEITRVKGAGNSIETLYYSYNDNSANNGDNYYRLVQVDYDGTRSASEMIVATCYDTNTNQRVDVYPNPFADEVNIVLENFNGNAEVVIFDMLGRVIYERKLNVKGQCEFIVDYDFAPATYNLRITSGDVVINKLIVKQ